MNIRNMGFFAVKVFSIPVILYGIFFLVRINGFQPPAEAELGEFLTALFFIFGSSISYFIFASSGLENPLSPPREALWWWLLSAFLLLLAFDEIYMIHENLSKYLKIRELLVFLVYGAILCTLVFFRRQKITKTFMFFFVGFVGLSGLSVIVDSLFSEGLIVVFGKEIDYEQLAESLAALSLSTGFAVMAGAELEPKKRVG